MKFSDLKVGMIFNYSKDALKMSHTIDSISSGGVTFTWKFPDDKPGRIHKSKMTILEIEYLLKHDYLIPV